MTAPNFENRTVWTGDNLDVLRGINSWCVDLLYLDPPFNSNKSYSAPIGSKAAGAVFKDTWTLDDVDEAWHGEVADREPALYSVVGAAGLAHGKGMKSYLIMMAVRLLEMRRILKKTGSIYLHCDPTASHYLKLLMDVVFGAGNFLNEIVWRKIRSAKGQTVGFGAVHDTVLAYRRSSERPLFNRLYAPLSRDRIRRHYGKTEQGTGRRYGLDNFTQAGQGDPRRFGDRVIPPPPGKHWIWSQDRIDEAMEEGRLVVTSPAVARQSG